MNNQGKGISLEEKFTHVSSSGKWGTHSFVFELFQVSQWSKGGLDLMLRGGTSRCGF